MSGKYVDGSARKSGDDSGRVLWTPSRAQQEETRIGAYLRWLREERDLQFDDYDQLWKWSVTDLDGFWNSIWDHFEVIGQARPARPLSSREMPGTRWFEGARLNYAEHALRAEDPDATAIVAFSQTRSRRELTHGELVEQVARARTGLRRLGVGAGDRVVAYMPAIHETTVLFLATASLGAVWAVCPPEFGVRGVVSRLGQLEPKVLLTVDGYRYGDKAIDRIGDIKTIRSEIPTLEATVLIPYLDEESTLLGATSWDELIADKDPLTFEPTEFSDPLWVLFSSGTTGLPKAIVHGHGGIVLEHLKSLAFQHDIKPGDRFQFYSSTAWMVWNLITSSLLVGAGTVLFDGNPVRPDLADQWRVAEESEATHLGLSASYLMLCRKSGVEPRRERSLEHLRFLVSAGSPLPAAGFDWVYEHLEKERVFLTSGSGGTDVCSGFVGAVPVLPVNAGEMTGKQLGAKAEAFDTDGAVVIDELGELVITAPMPSMPIYFWNDPGNERYQSSYFDLYPGVWRHGDWIFFTSRGTSVITGRSDATLNRGGVRLGTAELCDLVESFDQVSDSLIIHLEDPEGVGMGTLMLFVALGDGAVGDDDLSAEIAGALRNQLSPRHVPDEIHFVPTVPRTLTGKKLEVPVKRILQGADPSTVVNLDAIGDPDALQPYLKVAAGRAT
jgi:acetoacetyl-CoA synthetase